LRARLVAAVAHALGQEFPPYDGTHCLFAVTLGGPLRCSIGVAP